MLNKRNGTSLTIREVRPSDAPSLETLYRTLISNHQILVLPEQLEAIGADHNTYLFVCESNGSVQGTALLNVCMDAMFQRQPFGIIENVVVTADKRRRGVGTALLRHVEAVCRQRDCSKIMLLSSSERGDAHRFFEGLGYSSTRKVGFVKYQREFDAE